MILSISINVYANVCILRGINCGKIHFEILIFELLSTSTLFGTSTLQTTKKRYLENQYYIIPDVFNLYLLHHILSTSRFFFSLFLFYFALHSLFSSLLTFIRIFSVLSFSFCLSASNQLFQILNSIHKKELNATFISLYEIDYI